MAKETLYEIHWKDPVTGRTGHGEPISGDLADAHVAHLNRTSPLVHKAVPVKRATPKAQ